MGVCGREDLGGGLSAVFTLEQGLWCADMQGFSLHAAVRCGAEDRKSLEQLCRYITRPALANESVQSNAAGQVVLKPKTPWRDGTTHLVMSPLEFMQRRGSNSSCSCMASGPRVAAPIW